MIVNFLLALNLHECKVVVVAVGVFSSIVNSVYFYREVSSPSAEGFNIQDCQLLNISLNTEMFPWFPGESLVGISLVSQTWEGGREGGRGRWVVLVLLSTTEHWTSD